MIERLGSSARALTDSVPEEVQLAANEVVEGEHTRNRISSIIFMRVCLVVVIWQGRLPAATE